MTREEAIECLINERDNHINNGAIYETRTEAINMAIKALEQESETEQFAKWVAREIFDDMWEYNKDAFAEIACRKLAKMGIVNAKGDVWELAEPQGSEDAE